MSEAPAVAAVLAGAEKAEGGAVVNERDVRLPGELDESVVPVGQAFGEVFVRDDLHADESTGVEVFFAQG